MIGPAVKPSREMARCAVTVLVSADLAVLAVDRLTCDTEEGSDLGPAQPGMARSSNRHLLAPGQVALGLGERREVAHHAAVVIRPQ